MYKRVCEVCFKPFETDSHRRKYCSQKCSNEAKCRSLLSSAKKRDISKGVLERSKNLADVVRDAANAGMSYGKYVQAYLRG